MDKNITQLNISNLITKLKKQKNKIWFKYHIREDKNGYFNTLIIQCDGIDYINKQIKQLIQL